MSGSQSEPESTNPVIQLLFLLFFCCTCLGSYVLFLISLFKIVFSFTQIPTLYLITHQPYSIFYRFLLFNYILCTVFYTTTFCCLYVTIIICIKLQCMKRSTVVWKVLKMNMKKYKNNINSTGNYY